MIVTRKAMQLRRLFLKFPGTDRALFDMSGEWSLSSGFWSLTGRSGVGKTSFLRLLSGWFLSDDSGDISWLADLGWDALSDVDFIGNEPSLLPWTRVTHNIGLRAPNASSHDIMNVVTATGLDGSVLSAKPYELSLGMYKRVEFAAALLSDRKLLLLDEFFGSLDPDSRRRCYDLLRERRSNNITVMSTHSPETLPAEHLRPLTLHTLNGGPTIVGLTMGAPP